MLRCIVANFEFSSILFNGLIMIYSYFRRTPLFILSFLCIFLTVSCSSDEELKRADADIKLVNEAKSFLQGDIVLNTHATMGGVNKTLLPTGCPTKFNFTWSKTAPQSFTISLLNFTVGKMGMIINFNCEVKTMQLNSWEKNEYKGEGWIKFYGENGSVSGTDNEGVPSKAMGSTVKGYYNVMTHQINFIVNYNMMNVRSECFLQTIDKNRIKTYNEDFKKYEEDLKKYKEEHGL